MSIIFTNGRVVEDNIESKIDQKGWEPEVGPKVGEWVGEDGKRGIITTNGNKLNIVRGNGIPIMELNIEEVSQEQYQCCGCKCFGLNPPQCCWSCKC